MAEVYRDKTSPHRSSMNWIVLALIAAVALVVIIALAR